MITHTLVEYEPMPGRVAVLELPVFIIENNLFPFDLPIDKWPTFCGPGGGFFDKVIPDYIGPAGVQPACFGHDVDFSYNDGTYDFFCLANTRLRRNIDALVVAQYDGRIPQALALEASEIYWRAVSKRIGWTNYNQDCEKDWRENKDVKEKLDRLAWANMENCTA